MAGTSLLALIDDITAILDDVALMSKVAASKTVGVLGDDLALNAQQLAGLAAERELPVVWAVAVGSLKNKAVLVPAALAISALAPWGIAPLLMAGGVYLCYEGVEKIVHALRHHAAPPELAGADADAAVADPAQRERELIRGAVRTDFVLSAEIIVIALGTVAGAPFGSQLLVLAGVAVLMTAGVYGVVAAIVKLDDAGLFLSRRAGALTRALGRVLLAAAPRLMRLLSVVGTAAMFTVGGGILTHHPPAAHELIEHAAAAAMPAGPLVAWLVPLALEAATGVLAGALALGAVGLGARLPRALKRPR